MTRFVIPLTVVLLASGITASAQTRYVTSAITGGSFNADTSSPNLRASYDITGPGFHFVADGVEPGAIAAAITCFAPGCRPGDVVSLSGNFSGSYLGRGVAIVGGETLSPAYFSGVVVFEASPVTIPKGNRKHLVLTTPFTLVGTAAYPGLSVWEESPVSAVEPWTVATLVGGGTVTAFFRRDQYPKGMPERFYYVLERVIYSFTGPASE